MKIIHAESKLFIDLNIVGILSNTKLLAFRRKIKLHLLQWNQMRSLYF